MKTLRYFWRELSILYHESALQSLCNSNPSHPDIREIILEISRLKSERIQELSRKS